MWPRNCNHDEPNPSCDSPPPPPPTSYCFSSSWHICIDASDTFIHRVFFTPKMTTLRQSQSSFWLKIGVIIIIWSSLTIRRRLQYGTRKLVICIVSWFNKGEGEGGCCHSFDPSSYLQIDPGLSSPLPHCYLTTRFPTHIKGWIDSWERDEFEPIVRPGFAKAPPLQERDPSQCRW